LLIENTAGPDSILTVLLFLPCSLLYASQSHNGNMTGAGELLSGDYTRILEVFAELSPVAGVLLDASLRILTASATYLALFNLASDECIGMNVYKHFQAKAVSPGVMPLRHVIDTALDTKALFAKSGIEAANQTFWSLRAVPIFDDDRLLYLALEVADNTKEHLLHQAVLDKDDTYRILVETVKDYAIFMLDVNGNVRTWNAGATLLKGYNPNEIIGQHFSAFYSAADISAGKPQKELETCLRDGKVEDESWRYRKDGSRFWANVIITSIYRDGVHIGFSKVTRDLTERKAVESRLIAAYEESAKLKSAFLANISHEIRTPMHGMLSALTLLMDSALAPEQRELGGIIEESGGVLLQLIDDILDYSKLASGGFSICSDVISVSDVITSVVRSFQTTLKEGIRLRVSLDDHLPKSAQGDPLRYRQIVQNLVSNAVKFTESGFIHIHASVQRDEGSSYTVRTRVADTGIGVPDCAVGSLFTPFTQFDTSATKRYKGTGLGLSICKSLAELMGGSIGFYHNPEEHGSVFWFDVKVQKLESEKLANGLDILQLSPSLDPLSVVRANAHGKRILLAEDNFINQKVMLMMLKNLGFEQVDTATDGVETVQLATLQQPLRYDLILMDINMPVLDGIGSTIEIRKAGLNIPIIAMTANVLKGDVEVYLAKGMNDYIPKPVDRKLLMKALLNWLK
jgi:osomolarity two-component system sensor histidine kinase TcsA